MRALIRFDCFGVIFMTMIFTSSRFDDPLIYRACCFLWMLFLPRNLTAALLCSLLWGRGKVISHSDRYSIFKVQRKGLSLIPTGEGQVASLNGKIFENLKIPLTYLHKGYPNAHPFPGFLRKIFWKIYLFTYSHWQRSNATPKRENISEWKKLFTHLDKGCRNAHQFWGFLKKIFWENLSLHLFPLAECIWGQ